MGERIIHWPSMTTPYAACGARVKTRWYPRRMAERKNPPKLELVNCPKCLEMDP